ncbi:MAG: GAF domain-containing protein [Anaerolineae bacterium]
MINRIKRFFTAPAFEDEDKTRVARVLNATLLILLMAVVLLTASFAVAGDNNPDRIAGLAIGAATAALTSGILFLTRRGHVQLASVLLLATLLVMITLRIYTFGSIRSPFTITYLVGIVLAGLLLGGNAAVVFALLSMAATLGLFYVESGGQITAIQAPVSAIHWITYAITFGVMALLLRLAARHIGDALARARRNARALTESNRELQAIRASLEQRVTERTAQLNFSAEVSRAVTSILDQDKLIRQVVQLITDRFNFYFAAVFLVDDDGKFAVLREATGVAGQVLKESGYKLKVGGLGMISAAIVRRKPRLSGQMSSEPSQFANPLLPDTQSEIALPLVVGDRVFGALDVQSTQPAAFDDGTLALLQNLADQIAIALNNAQQVENAQREARQATALFEASQLAGSISENLASAADHLLGTVARQADFDAWAALTFDADSKTTTLLAVRAPDDGESAENAGRSGVSNWRLDTPTALAIRLRQPVVVNDPDIDPLLSDLPPQVREEFGKSVSAPAVLGDRVVGAIRLARAAGRASINPRDVELAQAVASQLAVTVENRRLLEQAQSAAAELTLLMRRYTREGWSQFSQARDPILYEYSRPDAGPFDPDLLLHVDQAARANSLEPAAFDGQATIGIPIALRGEVIGTLGMQAEKDRRWTEDEMVTLQAVADQVAQSIEAARLLDETESSLRETTELYHASQAIAGAQTSDDILHAFIDHILAPELDRCVLMLIDPTSPPDDRIVQVVATWKSSVAQPAPSDGRWKISYTPRLNTEPFVISDVATSPVLNEVGRHIMLNEQGIKAQAIIPLLIGGRPIGWLLVESLTGPHHFGDREIRLYRTLAGQAATAIENRRLLEETQRRAEIEAALNQISQTIRASLDPESVLDLQAAISEMGRVMRASRSFYVINHDDRSFTTVYEWCAPNVPSFIGASGAWADLPETFNALKSGRPIVTEIVDRDDLAELRPMMQEHGVLSHAHVPVVVGSRLIGIFGFDQIDRQRRWTPDEVNMLRRVAEQLAVALENARVYQETQRRAELEAALNRIGRTIKASLDPQAVLDLQATLGEMGRVIRSSRSCFLANEDDHRFSRAYEWCAPGVPSFQGTGEAWSNLPHSFKLFKSGQSIVTERVERDDPPELHAMMRAQGVLSHMHVPVLTGNRLIGILGFEQIDQQRRWTSEEVNLVYRVADQLAAALENARLYQNVRARVNELTALTRIGRRLTASLEFEDVLNTIVEEALNVTPADRGSIAIYDVNQDALELRVLIGYPEEAMRLVREGGLHLLRRGDGLHGHLLTTGQAVLSNDVHQDSAYIMLDSNTRSELIVPIKQGESLLGALNLESPRPYVFTESDQRLIEALADQAAVAIVNARAYEAERAALDRMREVDRLKTQFLANMSHELRTPLNSIIGFSRVILRGIDGPLTELQQADLTAIHNSGHHLLGLINDILDLSKIEAGKMELSPEDIDLRDIIKGVMSTAIALVKDKPVELHQDVPAVLPRISADSRRIRQVILNLVSNAAKFTDKGKIGVRVTVHPREAAIAVSDTGMGIPVDKLEHIFEEFTQVDASTTRKAGGSGLGLAISRRFVEMHGGRIWVDSQLGAGATFTFTLPLERLAEPQRPEPAATMPERDAGKKLILSIDDDPGVVTLYKRYLEKQGYQVIGLNDPFQAVPEAKRLQPFAITLDVLMPDRDGWSVLAELKSTRETSRTPIIVCSIIEDEGKGFSLGAADYLVKPITEGELLRALDRVGSDTPVHTVLVIDDEADAIRLLRRMLEARSGFRVIEAYGGAQGIAAVHQHRPDLVILDLMMPDVDGFAVLENIKGSPLSRNIPVIVVTAKDLTEEDRTRLQGKSIALLNKGTFESETLLGEIAATLERLSRKEPVFRTAPMQVVGETERAPSQ